MLFMMLPRADVEFDRGQSIIGSHLRPPHNCYFLFGSPNKVEKRICHNSRSCGSAQNAVARKEIYEPEVLRDVARWYHQDFLLKKEMREKLKQNYGRDYDERAIDRILMQAEERGAIRISYPRELADGDLAERLCKKYDLTKVIVVAHDSGKDSYDDLLGAWGLAAARYFEELVAGADKKTPLHVGISGGETLQAFATAVSARQRLNVHVHTLALVGRAEGAMGGPTAKSPNPKLLPTHIDPLVNAQILSGVAGECPGNVITQRFRHCHRLGESLCGIKSLD